jgi:calcium binding protein 39
LLQELLTQHRELVEQYLRINFDLFFSKYNALLQSPNYVTKRTSIKLLGELLLERINLRVMTAYVAQPENLKIAMRLLSNKQKMVAYEGFHVFKVFVANPQKSIPVQEVLIKNADKLLAFLPAFQDDRQDDEQFNDEKAFLIRQIKRMPSVPVVPAREEDDEPIEVYIPAPTR